MTKPVVVVGGGLAGLTCARALGRKGVPVRLFEATERVGGRVKTDRVEGFRLERGFQVHFDAYPHAQKELRQPALNLHAFRQGARIFDGERLHVVDVLRPFQTTFDSFLPFADKLRMGRMIAEALLAHEPRPGEADGSTEAYLLGLGISEATMRKFLRPFFGGVFVDPALRVSRQQFQFVLNNLLRGRACLPAKGMEQIPRQIAADLEEGVVRTEAPVASLIQDVDGRVTGVRLASGEFVEAAAVVVATDAPTAARLTGLPTVEGEKRSTTLYFEVPRPPVPEPIIVLNGTGQGIVDEVVPLSNVSPLYAPPERHLVSVTILSDPPDRDAALVERVKDEVAAWFPGAGTDAWRFLHLYRIAYHQLPQPPGFAARLPQNATEIPDLYFAGEFTTNGSIDGALESGAECARVVAEAMKA